MTSLIKAIDGEWMISAEAPEAVADSLRLESLPAEWLKAGRRRANEAAAHTGSREILDALTYWARKDLGVELVENDGEVVIP